MTIPIFERGIYTGSELQHRSSRPGAYDAFALPSLGACSARQVPPEAAAQPEAAAPIVSASTVHQAPPPTRDTPPPAKVVRPRQMATFSEVAAAHAALEQRKAELQLWRCRVAALEQSARLRALIGDLRRFAYSTHTSAI